jgi:hypothetical protein
MATKRKPDEVGESMSGTKKGGVDVPKTSPPRKLPKKAALVAKKHLKSNFPNQ